MAPSASAPLPALPPPAAYGLPERFSAWRPYQADALARVLASPKRFVALVAPTGFGKSILAETIARFEGERSCYVVVSKPLQDQIAREFPHRYDVRGKSNYDCKLLLDNGVYGALAKCDQAESLCESCEFKEHGCHYFDRVRRAKLAEHPITNYAFWLAVNRYKEGGIGEFQTLVLDECHAADQQLSSALRIEITGRAVEKFARVALPSAQSMNAWAEWAQKYAAMLRPRLDQAQQEARNGGSSAMLRRGDLRELKALVTGLEALREVTDDWLEDRSDLRYGGGGRVAFEPIWPAPYAGLLFGSASKVLLMSATVRPKTLDLLGVPREECEFLEFPSSFPVTRRPVTHVKTVQQRASMSDVARVQAVNRIDQIIDSRLDRKGIIHTVSYERARHLLAHSRHSGIMLYNEGAKHTDATVKRFRASPSPCVLVSPSVTTGYDFPGEECEYQILMKVPFPDSRAPLVKARQASDEDYGSYLAMQELVQAAGRGMRSAGDQCEVIVIDDMIGWFYFKCLQLGFVPGWFAPAVRLGQASSRVLPKLNDECNG